MPKLNNKQHTIYLDILVSFNNNLKNLYFLEEPTKSGKTFVYNIRALKFQSNKKIIVYVVSFGIVSQLSSSKLSTYFMFKIFLKLDEDLFCNITKNTLYSIIW